MESGERPAGTRMAAAGGVPATDAVWRNHRDQFFLRQAKNTSKLFGVIGCLVFVAMIAILANADYPTWRIVAAIVLYSAFLAGHRLVIRSTRVQGRVEHAFIMMNVMSQLFVVGMA